MNWRVWASESVSNTPQLCPHWRRQHYAGFLHAPPSGSLSPANNTSLTCQSRNLNFRAQCLCKCMPMSRTPRDARCRFCLRAAVGFAHACAVRRGSGPRGGVPAVGRLLPPPSIGRPFVAMPGCFLVPVSGSGCGCPVGCKTLCRPKSVQSAYRGQCHPHPVQQQQKIQFLT